MLQRITASNGVVFYRSPLLAGLGVAHAFSTRIGGISRGPFESLNLGNPNGCPIQDSYDHVWENYRILQSTIGCKGLELCRIHQVHSAHVATLRPGEDFGASFKGDAIVSQDPARLASVRVADCVPVLVSSGDGKTVAAVHAGWRGVVSGVLPAAIRTMHAMAPRMRMDEVVVAIGPCIGFEAFEVGPEVLEEFGKAFGPDAPLRRRADGKGHVDLREALRRQAIGAGVSEGQIDLTDRCTHRDAEEFFSHRREQGVTGRMAAVIAPSGSRPRT